MIETKEIYDYMISKNLDFFVGVPDSLLKDICSCIKENTPSTNNIIAANEGNAVGIAAGYHLSTGKIGTVYMQNSGIGNAVNPILSLIDEEVYKVPMLFIVGWRGEPGTKDEPQHVKQGKVTTDLFKAMKIEYLILNAENDEYKAQIDYATKYMLDNNKPIAIIVKKNSFTEYKFKKEKNDYTLTREKALSIIIDNITEKDMVVSTTGKTSREIFEIRENRNEPHSNDFLTVGSMGHTSSIALGMSIGTNKNVYCIDGDGSFLMHMGGLAIASKNAKPNFKYILINNGAHESVGGQPTIAFDIDIENIIKAFRFDEVYIASSEEEIQKGMLEIKNTDKKYAMIINVKQGSREDLGRPTISPEDNKKDIMNKIKNN